MLLKIQRHSLTSQISQNDPIFLGKFSELILGISQALTGCTVLLPRPTRANTASQQHSGSQRVLWIMTVLAEAFRRTLPVLELIDRYEREASARFTGALRHMFQTMPQWRTVGHAASQSASYLVDRQCSQVAIGRAGIKS
jgi:hypothetical protein